MSKPNHTPGPWKHEPEIEARYDSMTGEKRERRSEWVTSAQGHVALASSICDAPVNAQRIVACVNACEGIADPSIIPELIHWVQEVVGLGDNSSEMRDCVEYLRNLLARSKGRKPEAA